MARVKSVASGTGKNPEVKYAAKPEVNPEVGVAKHGAKHDLDVSAFSYHLVNGSHLLGLNPQEWALSRPLDEGHVDRLSRTQAERVTREGRQPDLFLPNSITVAMFHGQCIIMDGRLRLEVLRRLAGSGIDPSSVMLSLCEAQCGSQEEVEELHIRLNAGVALPASYYKKKFAGWLSDLMNVLMQAFPKAVSASDNPRRPKFNPTLVKKQLSSLPELQAAVTEGRLTVVAMMTMLHAENEIERKVSSVGSFGRGLTASLITKAKMSGFALGLRGNWPLTVAVRALALME